MAIDINQLLKLMVQREISDIHFKADSPPALRLHGDMVLAANLQKLSAEDVRFHETICRASGHHRLFGAWKGMANQIRLLSQQVIDTQYRDLADIPARHERLLTAIRSADAAAAEQEVRTHIDSVAKRVVETLLHRDEERERIAADGLKLIRPVGEERGL